MKISAKYSLLEFFLFLIFFSFLSLCLFFLFELGISGPFVFDDFAWLYFLSSFSDYPLYERIVYASFLEIGRPLAFASFFLDDFAWPSSPEKFKLNNLFFHALNTLLVFWFLYLVFCCKEKKHTAQAFLVLFVVFIWALHPIHVATVSYPIQRMTLLSSTFILLGLVTYLKIRTAFCGNCSIFFMVSTFLCMAIFGGLGYQCKEIAVLLPFYIFVLEFTVFSHKDQRLDDQFRKPFMAMLLAPYIVLFPLWVTLNHERYLINSYLLRDFTAYERILTQSRVLYDYLAQILMIKPVEASLFMDDYPIAKSVGDIFGYLIFWFALFILAIILRKKIILLSFAILWFLAGHFLESNVIGLELVFLHRNYLPSLGILVGLAMFLLAVFDYSLKIRPLAVVFSCFFAAAVCFSTYLNASTWGNRSLMMNTWLAQSEASVRANHETLKLYIEQGNLLAAFELSAKMLDLFPSKSGVQFNALLMQCLYSELDENEILSHVGWSQRYEYSQLGIKSLLKLFEDIRQKNCQNDIDLAIVLPLLHEAEQAAQFSITGFATGVLIELGASYAALRNLGNAMHYFDQAYALRPNVFIIFQQIEWLLSAGLEEEANAYWEKAHEQASAETLPFMPMKYRLHLDRYRLLIESASIH